MEDNDEKPLSKIDMELDLSVPSLSDESSLEKIVDNNSADTQKATPLSNKDKKPIKHESGAIVKIANLLLILSIILFSINGLIIFSTIGVILFIFLAVVVLLVTLFTLYNQFISWIEKATQVGEFIEQGYFLFPYLLFGGIGCGLVSLILFISDKNYIHRKSKIITNSVILSLQVALLIVRYTIFK